MDCLWKGTTRGLRGVTGSSSQASRDEERIQDIGGTAVMDGAAAGSATMMDGIESLCFDYKK